MLIRSHTWGAATISWAHVMESLLAALERLGHETVLLSTNGYAGSLRWSEEKARARLEGFRARGLTRFDLDFTYAKPTLWHTRFLASSRVKVAKYDYESSQLPDVYAKFWHVPDFVAPGSRYVAEIFRAAGCPQSKLAVVPLGVDAGQFSPEGPRLPLARNRYRFLCVAEPHYRKRLDDLIAAYCRAFTARDPVTLILKTRLFDDASVRQKKRYEIDLRPVLAQMRGRMGANMPDLVVIETRMEPIAPLYRSCDCFVLPTASEGWGMPFLEALACGLLVIAPDHGGQREFLDHDNAVLIPTATRNALPEEQYGRAGAGQVGAPDMDAFAGAMRAAFEGHARLMSAARVEAAAATVRRFSWEAAAERLLALAR